MKYLIFFLLLSCSVVESEIPEGCALTTYEANLYDSQTDGWLSYEYRVEDNRYIAFTKRHYYTVWYNDKNRGRGVSPNLICTGTYQINDRDGCTLTLRPYKSERKDYQVILGDEGTYKMLSEDRVEIWTRTKLNHYIK